MQKVRGAAGLARWWLHYLADSSGFPDDIDEIHSIGMGVALGASISVCCATIH
jgi:hypothetical protein